MFFRWASINIFTNTWWYKALYMDYIFFLDEIYPLLMVIFLLTFLYLRVSKKMARGVSSSEYYSYCGGKLSFGFKENFRLLFLILSLGSPCSASLKWFLIKKYSHLSPLFFKWASINIFTNPWWYKEVSMNYIFLWMFVAIFLKLWSRKYGRSISFPSRKFIIKGAW